MVTFIQPPSLSATDSATHSHSHDYSAASHGHDHDHTAFASTAPGGQRGADGLTDRERLIRDHGHDHSGMEFVGECVAPSPSDFALGWGSRFRASFRSSLFCAGKFGERDLPDFSQRNWKDRAFTIGIGG